MDPITLFAGLIPLLVEGGKAAISRWVAPDTFKPATVEQYISMKTADLEFFKALNAAGGANPSYLWVEAVVRLMRPFAVVIVLTTWADAHGFLWHDAIANTVGIDNFAGAVGFYLFGDRTLFYAKRAQDRQ